MRDRQPPPSEEVLQKTLELRKTNDKQLLGDAVQFLTTFPAKILSGTYSKETGGLGLTAAYAKRNEAKEIEYNLRKHGFSEKQVRINGGYNVYIYFIISLNPEEIEAINQHTIPITYT